jgi:hypothetical protein
LEDLAAVELLKMVQLSLAVAMAEEMECLVAQEDKPTLAEAAEVDDKTLAAVAVEVELLF